MSDKKVVRFKKKFKPNIAFFILILIFFYIIFLFWNYSNKEKVSIYEVNTSTITDDTPLYGFILRNEEVINAEQRGYINYYNPDASRIGVKNVVYTLDNDGSINNILTKIQNKKNNESNITAIREQISTFQNSFDYADYQQLNTFKYSLESALCEETTETLYSDLNKTLKNSGAINYTKITAKKSGVISYSIDGYENTKLEDINSELFKYYGSVNRKHLENNAIVDENSPAYRLVKNNEWSLVVELNDNYYNKIKDQKVVRITIDKDEISFNANVEFFEKDNSKFAKLTTSRYMERYINDRFLKIEFNLENAQGLKIPNTSILKKDYYILPSNLVFDSTEGKCFVKECTNDKGELSEQTIYLSKYIYNNGSYYVTTEQVSEDDVLFDASKRKYSITQKEQVQGVYCVNEGFCEFKPIEIKYKNNEYSIVSDTTHNGLTAFDHIVVDPTKLSDDDFIE